MQLWKKNFLAIYPLFQIVICTGLLFLNGYISQNETRQWVNHARSVEQSICYLAAGLKDETVSRISMNLSAAAEKYSKNGILIWVEINSYIVADSLPESLVDGKPAEIQKIQGQNHLIIRENRIVDGDIINVVYAESLDELSHLRARRMWIFCGAGFSFSAAIGILLYCTMRRINRPVNQISHELHTPLTGIRGYAEYLLMGNLTDEDRFFLLRSRLWKVQRTCKISRKNC